MSNHRTDRRTPLYARRPYLPIEIVIATVLIVGGLYILSPFFLPSAQASSGAITSAITHEIVQRLVGPLYMTPGLILGYGIWKDKRKFRKWGLFFAVLVILFIQSTAILTNGLRPLTWLYPVSVGIIAAVIWLRVRWEDNNGL